MCVCVCVSMYMYVYIYPCHYLKGSLSLSQRVIITISKKPLGLFERAKTPGSQKTNRNSLYSNTNIPLSRYYVTTHGGQGTP